MEEFAQKFGDVHVAGGDVAQVSEAVERRRNEALRSVFESHLKRLNAARFDDRARVLRAVRQRQ